MIGRILACLLAWGLVGCRVGALPVEAPAHGNVLLLGEARCGVGEAACDRVGRRSDRHHDPLVVLIEGQGLRAVEPGEGLVRWWRPMPVVGHPVADATTVFVPVRGHELAGIDRRTGEVRFRVPLPGEALTGLTMAGPLVVATVVDPRRERSEIVALSGVDGRRHWVRASPERLGAPAAKGKVVWVPQGRQVLALHRRDGRELARVDVPADALSGGSIEQVFAQGRALVAGRGQAWIDLRTATGGVGAASHAVEPGYASVFAERDRLDPGHGDDERTRMWLGFPDDAGPPREGVMSGRRAVVSFRLGPDGAATRARWAWLAEDRRELIALDVGPHRVTLVREDGSLVVLSRRTGEELDRLSGGASVRGALLLDMGRDPVPEEGRSRVPDEVVRAQLVRVLEDVDPRLLPAQTLAARLLWRDDDPLARETVRELARGTLRADAGEAADALRAQALELTRGAWGAEAPQELEEALRALARRPSFSSAEHPVLAPLAREVARSGRPEMVPHLVAHLLHPGTRDTDLTEIAGALVAVGHPGAIDGVATFVRRYHADPQIVYASRALQLCIDYLAAQADGQETSSAGARVARAVLRDVWRDPFTEPSLRAYIAPRLPQAAAEEGDDGVPPELPEVLHLGL